MGKTGEVISDIFNSNDAKNPTGGTAGTGVGISNPGGTGGGISNPGVTSGTGGGISNPGVTSGTGTSYDITPDAMNKWEHNTTDRSVDVSAANWGEDNATDQFNTSLKDAKASYEDWKPRGEAQVDASNRKGIYSTIHTGPRKSSDIKEKVFEDTYASDITTLRNANDIANDQTLLTEGIAPTRKQDIVDLGASSTSIDGGLFDEASGAADYDLTTAGALKVNYDGGDSQATADAYDVSYNSKVDSGISIKDNQTSALNKKTEDVKSLINKYAKATTYEGLPTDGRQPFRDNENTNVISATKKVNPQQSTGLFGLGGN